MKYTFDKFKIQLVIKQNKASNKNIRLSQTLSKYGSSNKRYIKTAQISQRKKYMINQEQMFPKTSMQQNFPSQQLTTNMTRSQSLKSQVKDQYKQWINSSVNSSQKQKEYRIFQQKCMDILSKKKKNQQNQRRSKISVLNNKNKLFFSRKQQSSSKQHTVEEMMNNIIEKFKNTSRIKHIIQHQKQHLSKQKLNFPQRLEASSIKNKFIQQKDESFFTIKNQFAQFTNNNNIQIRDTMPKQQKQQIFQMIKSTELRRNFSLQTKYQCLDIKNKNNSPQKNAQSLQQTDTYQNKKYPKDWKDVPQVTGVRMNRKLGKQEIKTQMNPIICTSLSLKCPYRDLKKNLQALQHIKLSPYSKLMSASSPSKRKKIHLNKPSNLKKFMKFNKNSSDQQYNKKIKAYLDFLFKINFSNNIYVSLQLLSLQDTISNNHKYKVYVGPGNNCLLIKSLLRRRQWLQIVDNINQDGIQFFWTQNKINEIHQKQLRSTNYRQSCRTQKTTNQKKRTSLKAMGEIKELNSKILSSNKVQTIQELIFQQGYEIPFDKQYEANVITNHIPQNYVIGSKKNLFKSLFSYYTTIVKKDPFTVLPKTYHIKSSQDPEFKRFIKENCKETNKLWIIKPGQNTNRGNGIKLRPFSKIQSLIKEKVKHPNGHLMTYIIQSYINKPFLYNGRKFDIRHYILVTSVNGILKVYWYRDGYIRTSSEMYDIQEPDNEFIHLTNDAIQQKSQSYGVYEDANKLSYTQFQRYLDYSFTGKGFNFDFIVKQMKSIMLDVIKASYLNLDKDRKKDNFELFGFDFMIDSNFKPYLIQINFNPCLVVNCSILNRIIPPLVQNTLRIGLDPLLTPKNHLPVNKRNNLSENYLKNLRYQLIFDEASLQSDIYNKPQIVDSQDQEQQYCDNGNQLSQTITF